MISIMLVRLNVCNNVCEIHVCIKNCAGGGGGGGERDFFLLFHVHFNTMAVFKSGFISRLLHNVRGLKKKCLQNAQRICVRE